MHHRRTDRHGDRGFEDTLTVLTAMEIGDRESKATFVTLIVIPTSLILSGAGSVGFKLELGLLLFNYLVNTKYIN